MKYVRYLGFLPVVLICSLLIILPAWARNLDPAKPNVLVLYYDDMGWSDFGANDKSQTSFTPRLDTLAGECLRFTAGHSADAVCTPSRYAIMTGRYCWRTSRKSGVGGGYTKPLMAADRFTIGGMFQQMGYTTAMVGKWHVGMQFYSPAGTPVDLGSDSRVLREVNIHHNYVAQEEHFGRSVWVHRKGATAARAGQTGLIPGSMGTASYVVEGLGEADSFESCSHGAGRCLGRRQACRELSRKECDRAMEGVVFDGWKPARARGLKGLLDLEEAPLA